VKPFVQVDARQDVFTMASFLPQPVDKQCASACDSDKRFTKVDMMTISFLCLVICAVIKSKELFFGRILHVFKSTFFF
jgi:hypothetical protein